MSTFLVIVAIVIAALFVIVVLTFGQATKVPPETPADVTVSVSPRERLVEKKRLERRADLDASRRPRAERLWNRVKEQVDALAIVARASGIEVTEVDLGVQFDTGSESLHVQVDFSEADPEFLVWTEQRATGDSSGLQRVRQVRAMLERASDWVEGHAV